LEQAAVSTRHLNQRELAERLNISPRTLERWRWLGEGPAFLKLGGGRVVYRLQDVESYEAEQLRVSTTTPRPVQSA
jgi:predicted site-specific integrase-resolvase